MATSPNLTFKDKHKDKQNGKEKRKENGAGMPPRKVAMASNFK